MFCHTLVLSTVLPMFVDFLKSRYAIKKVNWSVTVNKVVGCIKSTLSVVTHITITSAIVAHLAELGCSSEILGKPLY